MSALRDSAFGYSKPTGMQMQLMSEARAASKVYADELERILPAGPDKTYVLRKVRETAMWANVSIMREAEGAPRA